MGWRKKRVRETFECPHCGEPVVVGAAACRECGSDASTGWQDDEEVEYQSLDIPSGWGPDDESPGRHLERPRWLPWVAGLLALLMIVFVLRFLLF